jgi:DNA-cytosine methyltransferase
MAAPRVTIGSDCAGMDPIQWVLEDLNVPFRMQFISEVNKACQRFQARVHKQRPVKFDTDMTTRTAVNRCHFYIAGFPCQPFSAAGSRRGPKDRRGQVAKHVIRAIEESKPFAFLLENVPGLLKLFPKFHEALLRRLRDIGDGRYQVGSKLLDSRSFGLPQRRQRLYIIGIAKTHMVKSAPFTWPAAAPRFTDEMLGRKLDSILGAREQNTKIEASEACNFSDLTLHDTGRKNLCAAFKKIRSEGGDPAVDSYVVDIGTSATRRVSYQRNHVPTLTASRCVGKGYWSTNRHRVLSLREMLLLQGLPADAIMPHITKENKLTEAQVAHMVGNGMSLPVIKRLVKRVLMAAGLQQ